MDEATETRAADFWTRMRGRKVVQWGVAYAAGAWGLLQGHAYLSTLLDWPAQLQKLTGLALLMGRAHREDPGSQLSPLLICR